METIVFTKERFHVPERILEELAEIMTAEEVREIITVKEKEVTVTVPERIKKMEFKTEIPMYEEFEEVIATIEELTLEEALEILVETDHVTFEEFKEVLFKITPETEITKKLKTIFIETIKETKEEKTNEKIYYLLKARLIELFEEMEVMEKHKYLARYFETELREFIETLKPEYVYVDEFDEETKEVRMKKILLAFLKTIKLIF